MFVATLIVSVVLAVVLIVAAARKLSHREPVVRSYLRVGVPESWLNQLAMVLLAGAAGLLAGLAWAPIGAVTAIGVIGYFVLASAAHLKVGDRTGVATPVALAAVAVAALTLQLARL